MAEPPSSGLRRSSTSPDLAAENVRPSLVSGRPSIRKEDWALEQLGAEVCPPPGTRVLVGSSQLPAMIRFAGPTSFASGMWVGLELDEPQGRNDGMVKNVRYFQCKDKYGLFVRPHTVVRDEDQSARGRRESMRVGRQDSMASNLSVDSELSGDETLDVDPSLPRLRRSSTEGDAFFVDDDVEEWGGKRRSTTHLPLRRLSSDVTSSRSSPNTRGRVQMDLVHTRDMVNEEKGGDSSIRTPRGSLKPNSHAQAPPAQSEQPLARRSKSDSATLHVPGSLASPASDSRSEHGKASPSNGLRAKRHSRDHRPPSPYVGEAGAKLVMDLGAVRREKTPPIVERGDYESARPERDRGSAAREKTPPNGRRDGGSLNPFAKADQDMRDPPQKTRNTIDLTDHRKRAQSRNASEPPAKMSGRSQSFTDSQAEWWKNRNSFEVSTGSENGARPKSTRFEDGSLSVQVPLPSPGCASMVSMGSEPAPSSAGATESAFDTMDLSRLRETGGSQSSTCVSMSEKKTSGSSALRDPDAQRHLAQHRLAQAAEDHDTEQIRQLLPHARELGVAASELESATSVMHFEVQRSLIMEIDDVRHAVAVLAQAVESAERRAIAVERSSERESERTWSRGNSRTPLANPAVAADEASQDFLTRVVENLERKVWEGLESHVEALRTTVSEAASELTSAVQEIRHLRGRAVRGDVTPPEDPPTRKCSVASVTPTHLGSERDPTCGYKKTAAERAEEIYFLDDALRAALEPDPMVTTLDTSEAAPANHMVATLDTSKAVPANHPPVKEDGPWFRCTESEEETAAANLIQKAERGRRARRLVEKMRSQDSAFDSFGAAPLELDEVPNLLKTATLDGRKSATLDSPTLGEDVLRQALSPDEVMTLDATQLAECKAPRNVASLCTAPHVEQAEPDVVFHMFASEDDEKLGFKPTGLPPKRLFVEIVSPNSLSSRSGVREGDELIAVNGHNVTELACEEFLDLMKHTRPLQMTFTHLHRPSSPAGNSEASDSPPEWPTSAKSAASRPSSTKSAASNSSPRPAFSPDADHFQILKLDSEDPQAPPSPLKMLLRPPSSDSRPLRRRSGSNPELDEKRTGEDATPERRRHSNPLLDDARNVPSPAADMQSTFGTVSEASGSPQRPRHSPRGSRLGSLLGKASTRLSGLENLQVWGASPSAPSPSPSQNRLRSPFGLNEVKRSPRRTPSSPAPVSPRSPAEFLASILPPISPGDAPSPQTPGGSPDSHLSPAGRVNPLMKRPIPPVPALPIPNVHATQVDSALSWPVRIQSEGQMQVCVHCLSGEEFDVELEQGEVVGSVRSKIAKHLGVSVLMVDLVWRNEKIGPDLDDSVVFKNGDHISVNQSKEALVVQYLPIEKVETIEVVMTEDLKLGFKPSGMPPSRVFVAEVEKGLWADLNGVARGDELAYCNGVSMQKIEPRSLVSAMKGRPLRLTFTRKISCSTPSPAERSSGSFSTAPGNLTSTSASGSASTVPDNETSDVAAEDSYLYTLSDSTVSQSRGESTTQCDSSSPPWTAPPAQASALMALSSIISPDGKSPSEFCRAALFSEEAEVSAESEFTEVTHENIAGLRFGVQQIVGASGDTEDASSELQCSPIPPGDVSSIGFEVDRSTIAPGSDVDTSPSPPALTPVQTNDDFSLPTHQPEDDVHLEGQRNEHVDEATTVGSPSGNAPSSPSSVTSARGHDATCPPYKSADEINPETSTLSEEKDCFIDEAQTSILEEYQDEEEALEKF